MNKKILILIPPTSVYPSSFAYVAAVLNGAMIGYDVYAFDYNGSDWGNNAWRLSVAPGGDPQGAIQNIPVNYAVRTLFDRIIAQQYDVILTGGLLGYFRWFYTILPMIRKISPESKIIMGGNMVVDLNPNTLFEHLQPTYLLRGEAETNLAMLLEILATGKESAKSYYTVPGLVWKDDCGEVHTVPTRRHDMNRDYYKPAWQSLNVNHYIEKSRSTVFHHNKTYFPIHFGRGCSNRCAFCSPTIGTYIPTEVGLVIEEMLEYRRRYQFDIFFVNSEIAFNNEAVALEFCAAYMSKLGVAWVGQIRPDFQASASTYRLLKEANCKILYCGFESPNDRILGVMKKNATSENQLDIIRKAKDAGLNLMGNFVVGHESETAAEIQQTFAFIRNQEFVCDGVGSMITYPGTKYYNDAFRAGKVEDPLKFLLTYAMSASIGSVNLRNANLGRRINITALDDDEYYNTICREFFAANQSVARKQTITLPRMSFSLGKKPGWVFSGTCPHCGATVEIQPEEYSNIFDAKHFCDGCYNYVLIDIFALPEMEGHVKMLRAELAAAQRIVLAGPGSLLKILGNGTLDLQYDRILTWCNPESLNESETPYFFGKKNVGLKELQKAAYDLLLAADEVDTLPDRLGLSKKVKRLNLFPAAYNQTLMALLRKGTIALVRSAHTAAFAGYMDKEDIAYQTFEALDLLASYAQKFDYVVFGDANEKQTRENFALNTSYRIEQLIGISLLQYGGWLAGKAYSL